MSHPDDQPADGRQVFIVDDDGALREALSSLFRSVGLNIETFASADEFLGHSLPMIPSCLILDVRLQYTSGLEFQTQLQAAGIEIPIIFITGHGDIAMTVKAMKAGAVDFLAKPFRDQDLLDAVSVALEKDRKRREGEKQTIQLQKIYATLTAREQEVMGYAASGLMNKQIASEMNLSEITVKIHRGHAMKKMQAKSFAELVRMAELLGVRRKG